MANSIGIGASVSIGAKAKAPAPYPILNIDKWLEEKERERQRQLAEQQQKARATSKPVAPGVNVEATGVKLYDPYHPDTATSRQRAYEYARQPDLIKSSRPVADPLVEYQALAKTVGKEALDERISKVGQMWETYNSTFSTVQDAQEVIWSLAKSGMDMTEIREMIEGASGVLGAVNQGRFVRQEKVDDFMATLRNDYGLDDASRTAFENVFRVQEGEQMPTDFWTGIFLISCLIPIPGIQGFSWAARGANAAIKMGKFYRGMKVIQTGAAAGAEHFNLNYLANLNAEEKAALATNQSVLNPLTAPTYEKLAEVPAALQPFPMDGAFEEAYRQVNVLRGLTDTADVHDIQKALQAEGYGEELELTSRIEGSWIPVILEYQRDVISECIEIQRMCKEDHDAPHDAVIDGNLEGGDWPRYIAHRHSRLAAVEAAREKNPDWYAWLEMTGVPTTAEGWTNYFNKWQEHGALQSLFKLPIMAIEHIGGTWQSVGAAINLSTRQRRDPLYQNAYKALESYVLALRPELSGDGEQSLPLLTPAVVKEVTEGSLKDDPEAQELYRQVLARQSALIAERYSPDYALTVQHLLGRDYESVNQWGRDHPDLTNAITVATDVAVAMVNPVGRFRRATTKRPIPYGDPSDFTGSIRARGQSRQIADLLYEGGAANRVKAGRIIGGSEGPSTLSRLWLERGKNKRVDAESKVIQDVARDVAKAIETDNYALLHEALRGAPSAFVGGLYNKYKPHHQMATGWVGSVDALRVTTKAVGRAIARQQNKYGDAISRKVMRERVLRNLADAYAKKPHVSDIFPHLRDAQVPRRSRVMSSLLQSISEIQNQPVRNFLASLVMPWHKAPPTAVEMKVEHALTDVVGAAWVASRDIGWTMNFANRFMGARSKASMRALERQLAAKANQTFIMPGVKGPGTLMGRTFAFLGKVEEQGGQSLAPWENIQARTRPGVVAEESVTPSLTAYMDKHGTIKQAVPDTPYEQYMIKLPRAALWAPYRTPRGASLLKKALINTQNVGRLGIWTAHYGSRIARQATVAMGFPMLFCKHAVVDSGRTAVEMSPFVFLEAIGVKGRTVKGLKVVPELRSRLKRRYDAVLEEIDPRIRDLVLHTEARVHASMAQFYVGKLRVEFKPRSIRDEGGRIVDLDGSAAALRRVAQGEGFRQYAQGGEMALWSWLQTKAGKQALSEWGWTSRVKALWEESGIPTKGKQRNMLAQAQKDYIELMMKEWTYLDGALPNIMPVLKQMTLGNQILSERVIADLIRKYPTDNATLSMPANPRNMTSVSGAIVGRAMAANKWNRDIFFRRVYTQQYRKLAKEGANPNEAAQVAATVAELRTSAVHFDLANALMIEARHRWAIWFATKHRLYNVYLFKLAAERPMIAGAALGVRDWMEERNKNMGITGYDKYDLVLNVGGGKQWRMNLAPQLWLSEFPAESSLLAEMENVGEFAVSRLASADVLNAVPWQVRQLAKPAPTPFGTNIFRGDALIATAWQVLHSGNIETADQLEAWLQGLSAADRRRWNKLINIKRAEAIARGEKFDSPGEEVMVAFNRAKAASWKFETMQAFKLYSGRGFMDPLTPEELEIERLQNQFYELSDTDPDAAHALLQGSRLLQASVGLSADPVEKIELDEAFILYNQLNDSFSLRIEEMSPEELARDYDTLVQEYYDRFDELKAEFETFARYFDDTNPKELIKALGFLMPFIPADSGYREYLPVPLKEKEEIKAGFKAEFDTYIKEMGSPPSNSMIYQIKKRQMVDDEYARIFPEESDPFVTRTAQTMARWISRGGKTGPYKADVFLDLVRSEALREIMGRATRDGRGQRTYAWMALLSPEERDFIGWNWKPSDLQKWEQYALMEWRIKEHRRANGIHPSSKAGMAMSAQLDQTAKAWAEQDPDWGAEYYVSMGPVHERFQMLGVGTAGTEADKGWATFLQMCADFHNDLDNTENPTTKKLGIGPRSQAAAPVTELYLYRVAKLAKENEEWWRSFSDSFNLTKFGFYWWSSDPALAFLRKRETSQPKSAIESELPWYSIYQEALEEYEEWANAGD